MNSRLFQLLAVLLVVACCVSGAMAGEVPHHWAVRTIPTHHSKASVVPPAKNLYGTVAAFVGSPYEASWTNPATIGGDLWPCFGGSTDGTGVVNATLCNEVVPDPTSGASEYYLPVAAGVFGAPLYTWSLTACDATSTASLPCGQTNTWYEDDTLDSTDELTYAITALQGTSYVAASGTVDFGVNPYGGVTGQNVIIYGDQNFGTMGQTGVNNGNCTAAYNYPLASAANPGGVYIVPAGKTCVAPKAGAVALTATTELGTPSYKKVTKGTIDGTPCTVTAPCYTVAWKSVYKLAQKWTIWLE